VEGVRDGTAGTDIGTSFGGAGYQNRTAACFDAIIVGLKIYVQTYAMAAPERARGSYTFRARSLSLDSRPRPIASSRLHLVTDRVRPACPLDHFCDEVIAVAVGAAGLRFASMRRARVKLCGWTVAGFTSRHLGASRRLLSPWRILAARGQRSAGHRFLPGLRGVGSTSSRRLGSCGSSRRGRAI